ncbi:MAG: ankyrin repeat domain-containing protein [Magnetococcales bacterium]|nr:ankyrin repeat domain-containing protein [Magnetococcales bacterium]
MKGMGAMGSTVVTVIWRFGIVLVVYGWLGCVPGWAGTFHQAAFQGRLETVKRLIAEKKNDVNEADGFGSTPLHHAAMGGNTEMVNWLLNNGAAIEARDAGGYSPLVLALRNGKTEVAKLLVKAGADIGVLDNLGGSVLASAAYLGDSDLVEMILNRGAEVNHANELGLAPLHLATLANSKKIMKLLLGHGANANAKDKSGETPLNKVKDDEARQLLWQHGARLVKNRDDALVEQPAPKGTEE